MDIIELENMEFYSYHGVMAEEQKIGGHYLVNLSLELDLSRPAKTDKLEDTVNYAQVYHLIKKQMQKKARLIEHVADNIVSIILNEFPVVKRLSVKVSKINPPVNGDLQKVSVILHRERTKIFP